MKSSMKVAALLGALLPGLAIAGNSPAPDGARVYIIWPYDGATVRGGKMWVRFGLQNMGVAPAGVEKPYTGHHHLIIDADLPSFDEEIPSDRHHIHYGKGFTEGRIELPPGKHTLQLLFADYNHVPHNPPIYSKKITIYVPAE